MKRPTAQFIALLLIIGAVLWNGWLLGGLNHGLAGYVQMSISELEVRGQPQAGLFDVLELASSFFLIVGSLALIIKPLPKRVLMVLIALVIGLIGILTIYDVKHPLDCNQYNNPSCIADLKAPLLSYANQLHNTESTITAYVTIVLALLVLTWAFVAKQSLAEQVVTLILLLGIVTTLAVLNDSSNMMTNAIAQRIWNLLVSIDIIIVAGKTVAASSS